MTRFVVFAAVLLAISPALAAEFYLVKDPTTQLCDIVTQEPDGTKLVMVGTTTYATKEEAKAARKAAKASGECMKKNKKSE
jgi:hypothetical protein